MSGELTPADWDKLRGLVEAVQAGRPIYYAISEAPEYAGNMSIMSETATNPWVIVCNGGLVPAWKERIPHIQEAQLANDGKTVVWGRVGI